MGPSGQGEAIEAGRPGIRVDGAFAFAPAPRWRVVPPATRLRRRGQAG